MAGKKRAQAPLEFRNPQLADALQTQDMAALAFAVSCIPWLGKVLLPLAQVTAVCIVGLVFLGECSCQMNGVAEFNR